MDLAAALEDHKVAIGSDRRWQARLRLLQALWREERGLPIGSYNRRGVPTPLGSRVAMPDAETTLSNYLTPAIGARVRSEVEASRKGDSDKLYGYPRIYEDLLSSQPLCFNLFAPLADDLESASVVGRDLWPDRVEQVTDIWFEHSPGRGDPRYLNNRSAFDVFIRHTTPRGADGFIGIEVKYHEPLTGTPATMEGKPYREVARRSGVFVDPEADELERLPLQQVWLDHLLALSMLQEGSHGPSGLFVFLYPSLNQNCGKVVDLYRVQLTDGRTFQPLLLEDAALVVQAHSMGSWIEGFFDRYLASDKLDQFDAGGA